MASDDIGTTIQEAHDKIKAFVQENFPEVNDVTFYSQNRDNIITPAFLYELEEIEMSDLSHQVGTGQIALRTRWCGYFVDEFTAENVKINLRKWAVDFALKIDKNYLGLKSNPVMFLRGDPDNFSPELDQFEVFKVEWEQVLIFGENEEVGEKEIYLGFVPLVGEEYIDEYILLNDESELP